MGHVEFKVTKATDIKISVRKQPKLNIRSGQDAVAVGQTHTVFVFLYMCDATELPNPTRLYQSLFQLSTIPVSTSLTCCFELIEGIVL